MKPAQPILIVELFPALHDELLALLRALPLEAWERTTAAAPWIVRDVVAHMLDTDIRRLSFQRDLLAPLQPRAPIDSYQGLVAFLNQLNAEWVNAARRISPALLIDFLAITGPQVARLFASLDPFAYARIGVAWAGEDQSFNWFDLAREYTEKWHHQQHIRDAVGAPGLLAPRWLVPALGTFVRGLPHVFRDVAAPDGTSVTLLISELPEGWTLVREAGAWQLYQGHPLQPDATAELDADSAWRLFTKGITPAEARTHARFSGDPLLAQQLLELVAIMA